jgi:hypothetical protein
MAKTRRPKNQAQAQFFDLAISKGWSVTTRGWPTFFGQRNGEAIAVEVVSSSGRKLRSDKEAVIRALMAAGVKCFLWSPEEGFTSLSDSGSLTAASGGKGGGSSSSLLGEGSGEGASAPFDSPPLPASRDGSQQTREAVDEVWGCYVLSMKPSSTIAGEEERKIIRAALKVASVKECKEAIEGCHASAYHMGDNPRRKKYNTISHILRGKRGKRTTREQIDMLRDIREKAIESGTAVVTSVDPALVAQRKDDVRRGFRLKGDPEAQQRAKAAEAWLKEHGIPTQRRADGYPLWPSGGNG